MKMIPITNRHETTIKRKNGKRWFVKQLTLVPINWLINEKKRLEADGIKCEIKDNVLYRSNEGFYPNWN